MNDNWLILETSGRVGKVALARGGAIARSVRLDDSRRHARDLAATVAQALQAESLSPLDLKGVMVGRGPGSYTGLRVGIMSAKALAFALGCQLRAVETFAAIVAQTPAEAESVWVIADALQEQVYAQQFARQDGTWKGATELRIESLNDWSARPRAGEFISGPGVAAYSARLSRDWRIVNKSDREPSVESLFAVGSKSPPLKREELFALEPLYLRGSSAEEKARGK
jgi:tRNA threonylcarbamoyladenosine biosynthesis protein TsaB